MRSGKRGNIARAREAGGCVPEKSMFLDVGNGCTNVAIGVAETSAFLALGVKVICTAVMVMVRSEGFGCANIRIT